MFRDIGHILSGAFHGCLISAFWLSGFYVGMKVQQEDYEKERKNK